jgi:predicted CDP-diglyceride synthetase/phosphatidate cytidylyltransferase
MPLPGFQSFVTAWWCSAVFFFLSVIVGTAVRFTFHTAISFNPPKVFSLSVQQLFDR